MSAEPGRALLAALADPATFAHAPAAVDLVQTHVSIVALAGDLVFKLKKPLLLPFLDFSTRERRRATCRDEVRLNRRLCPDTYLGVATLRQHVDGLRFDAVVDDEGPDDGSPAADDEVDFAVVMRRLPADRMLDALLRLDAVRPTEIEALARTIAAFHARADRSRATTELGAPSTLVRFAADNFTELAATADHGLPHALLLATELASARAFRHLLPRLESRAATGKVVDGHGDLHARNVCMTEPPTIYDCLEFSASLRCGDVANEIAFLAMDLRYRRAPLLAARFVQAYAAATGDTELPALLPPLVAYRAMVRCKVAALAAAESELAPYDRAGARTSAREHLLLAAAALAEATGPRWFVLCGPPGSGKSTLAHDLARVAAWPVVSTDLVRKELAGVRPTDRAAAEHYTADFTRRTYEEVLARATAATRSGAACALLDGNFALPEQRAAAAAAAQSAGAAATIVFVDVDRATSFARTARRAADPLRVSDADASRHAALWDRFAPPSPTEGTPVARVDAAEGGDRTLERALAALLAGPTA